MKKMLSVVASTFILLATACTVSAAVKSNQSTNQSASFTQTQAIARVKNVLGVTFPSKPEKEKSKIHEGGPAPGRTIPAILQTSVQRKGAESYLVTLSEQWSAKDFNGSANSKSNKTMLEHYWTFKVTPTSSTLVTQGGDFPPQAAK